MKLLYDIEHRAMHSLRPFGQTATIHEGATEIHTTRMLWLLPLTIGGLHSPRRLLSKLHLCRCQFPT